MIGNRYRPPNLSVLALVFSLLSTWLVAPGGWAQEKSSSEVADDLHNRVAKLNNDGVIGLHKSDFKAAAAKFEEALKLDPTYSYARENLALAYSLQAESLRIDQALRMLHKAMSMSPKIPSVVAKLDDVILRMGKNPKDFKDREELGDEAREAGDFAGAVIEYQAALDIKEDAGVKNKMERAVQERDSKWSKLMDEAKKKHRHPPDDNFDFQ